MGAAAVLAVEGVDEGGQLVGVGFLRAKMNLERSLCVAIYGKIFKAEPLLCKTDGKESVLTKYRSQNSLFEVNLKTTE